VNAARNMGYVPVLFVRLADCRCLQADRIVACHAAESGLPRQAIKGFSANLFTLASDLFHSRRSRLRCRDCRHGGAIGGMLNRRNRRPRAAVDRQLHGARFFIAALRLPGRVVFSHLLSPKLIPARMDKCEVMRPSNPFQLTGKNALVTGFAQRSWRPPSAVAHWPKRAQTWVATGRESTAHGASCDAISSAGRKTSYFFRRSVGTPISAERLFEKTIAEFGSIDILVNNAGAIRRAPAAEYPHGILG